MTKCQAIVDDWEHGGYHASMQRIHAPGDKPCSRGAKETVKHLELCTAHARMAREGLVGKDGRVAPRADIENVRKYPEKFPNGLHTWAEVKS